MLKIKQKLAIILSLILALSICTGCEIEKEEKKEDIKEEKEVAVSEKTENDANSLESVYGDSYPIDAGDASLTYWMPMTANISSSAVNYGELPVAMQLEKLTGVKVQYIHPSLTDAQERFQLMVSSGTLTDLIEYPWNNYPGGGQGAIDDGIIIPLNEEGKSMIDAWAPDFKNAVEQKVDVAREAKTNSGYYYATGSIITDRALNTTAGPIVRQDWLSELGLDMPETIDDWYVTLKAFKEKKGAAAPLSMNNQGFFCGFVSGAYGINLEFYHDKGTVKYGAAEPGYKDFLVTMNKWYAEGLFDNGFDTASAATVTQNLLEGKSGATWNALGGGIGALTNAIAPTNPNAIFAGAPYPVLKEGEKPQFGQVSMRFSPETAISVSCKDPELAMKWLNFGYTDDGHMLYNFGVEGISYEMVDGEPKYTEEITANPQGLSVVQAMAKYSHAAQGGNYCMDLRYLEQYASLPQQKTAWEAWADTDAFEHYIPYSGINREDEQRYKELYTAVSAHMHENMIKFIKGERPIEEFSDYVTELRDLGLAELIEIRQDAYEAFLGRSR